MGDKPRRWKAVGVLDIGSNFVRMGIYQTGKTGIQRLELLEQPLRLGHEVFATGRISVETVRQLSSVLKGYSQIMKEYGVTEYRAFANTALREAENRAYVLDQLRVQNSLTVEVLEDGEESALIYGELLKSPQLEDDTLLAYVGTGSIGAAVWQGGALQQSCSMTMGFLKLSEILRSQEDRTAHYYRVLEEYVETYFQRMELRLGRRTFPRLLLAGRQLSSIAALCGARQKSGAWIIEREQLEKVYDRIKGRHASVIAAQLDLPEEVAGQLVPMLAIYRRILGFTQADRLTALPAGQMDVVAQQLLIPAEKERYEGLLRAGALGSCRTMARREQVDIEHAERVRETSVLLFNKLKRLHGISTRRLLLLECAALLHEVGNRANVRNASLAAYDSIKQAFFTGLSEEDTLLTAEIARFGEPHEAGAGAALLPEKQRLLVDKLAAILVLADALDSSRQGKITGLKVRLEEERLVITAQGKQELLLEKWSFGEGAPFFENAFGIQPVLIYKKEFDAGK